MALPDGNRVSHSHSYRYVNRLLHAGELASAMELVFQHLGIDVESLSIRMSKILADRTLQKYDISIRELDSICDLAALELSFFVRDEGSEFSFMIDPYLSGIGIVTILIGSTSAKMLHDAGMLFEEFLNLERAPFPENILEKQIKLLLSEMSAPLLQRIKKLEDFVFSPTRRLSCFFRIDLPRRTKLRIACAKVSRFTRRESP
jgi:hypothetical protein